jgi:hypothetical protein
VLSAGVAALQYPLKLNSYLLIRIHLRIHSYV